MTETSKYSYVLSSLPTSKARGRPPARGPGGRGGGAARPVARLRPWSGPLVQPVALALAADQADFQRLGRSGVLAGADFPGYLRRTERQLRAMAAQGLEVHLRVLEPVDFADFCAAHGLSPQEAAARVAYAADPELAGDPFVYGGEGLAELLPDLVEDHLARMRISLAYRALYAGLGGDGEGDGDGGPVGPAAPGWGERLAGLLEYVSAVYLALVAGLGGGCHQVLLRVAASGEGADGTGGLGATAELCVEHGRVFVPAREAEALCVTLAAGLTPGRSGELLVHSTPPERASPGRPGRARPRTARGWSLDDGRLTPLGADGVRTLLARAHAGAHRPDHPGPVRVRPGFALPEPPLG